MAPDHLLIQTLLLFLLFGASSSTSHYLRVELSGSLPIILSSPHGGWIKPSNIPDREPGCYDEVTDSCTYTQNCTQPRTKSKCPITTVKDLKTEEVAEILFQKLKEHFGASPKIVVSNLARTKLDMNRERHEAACGHPLAEQVYDEYHGALTEAKDAIQGRGLLLDIHGHGRAEKWAMLGYLTSRDDLNDLTDAQLEDKADSSSIRYLASQSNHSFVSLLRGESVSFGAMMVAEGLLAVPSPANLSPGPAPYYRGGYITRVHGSEQGGKVDAIQIEIHTVNRTPRENRVKFSEALARVVIKYYETHYSGDNVSSSPSSRHSELLSTLVASTVLLTYFLRM